MYMHQQNLILYMNNNLPSHPFAQWYPPDTQVSTKTEVD